MRAFSQLLHRHPGRFVAALVLLVLLAIGAFYRFSNVQLIWNANEGPTFWVKPEIPPFPSEAAEQRAARHCMDSMPVPLQSEIKFRNLMAACMIEQAHAANERGQ